MMEGKISISRPQRGDDRYISLQIKCSTSRTRFLEVEIDLETFSSVLTGLSEQPCKFKVRDLDTIGKTKISEPLVFPVLTSIPLSTTMKDNWKLYSKKKEVAAHVATALAKDYDCIAVTAFGSKGSFFRKDGVDYARTTMHKFVSTTDKPKQEENDDGK